MNVDALNPAFPLTYFVFLQRKSEMHGLKDILVRENDNRARETADLRVHVDAGLANIEEVVEREVGMGETQASHFHLPNFFLDTS